MSYMLNSCMCVGPCTSFLEMCCTVVYAPVPDILTVSWRGLEWTFPSQGHAVWSRLCCGSCGDSVIILAPLIPIHFSCLITSSISMSAFSRLCCVAGELSSLSVLIKVKETTSSWTGGLKHIHTQFTGMIRNSPPGHMELDLIFHLLICHISLYDISS